MPVRFIVCQVLVVLSGLTLAAQSNAPHGQGESKTPETAHQLWLEDQDDIGGGANGGPRFTEEEYRRRVQKRQADLRAMLAAGEIQSGDDFRDAAFIFQHSDEAKDCLFAHILAMEAVAHGTTSARFIEAATLDRYLQFTQQPQVFGTQYITDRSVPLRGSTSGLPLPFGRKLEPYDASLLSDSVRSDFCVPSVAQQKQNIVLFNRGEWPRDKMHPPCR